MSDFRERQPVPGAEPELQGLLFTGEVIRSLMPEQLEAVGRAALSFGVEMRLVHNSKQDLDTTALAASEQREDEQEPTPATLADFRHFAAEHGYTDRRSTRAFDDIKWTQYAIDNNRTDYPHLFRYPPIRYLNPNYQEVVPKEQIVDLRSVYERIKGSDGSRQAWGGVTAKTLGFIAHLVNEKVRPDEPLPVDPKHYQ